MYSKLITFFLPTLICINCFIVSCDTNTQQDKDKKKLELTAQYFLSLSGTDYGELAARLYYINPSFKVGTSLNLDLVVEASSKNVNASKKKIILIHGWDYTDRDNKSFSLSQQRDRIITNGWSDFIKSPTFDLIVLAKSYDVFAYDYLTSNSIDANGRRLRSKLDSLFGSETNTVVIIGHSMGGLISRFAIYEGTKPTYINRVITLGTPYHGSPWASSQFQADKGSLGDIAAFMTNTNGGKELAWDNFDQKIAGASNEKLSTINAKTDRDSLFYAYYGSINAVGNIAAGASNPGLSLACPILGSSFAPSDCIVPASSATLSGNSLSVTRDLGAYDHSDIKLLISTMQSTLYGDIP